MNDNTPFHWLGEQIGRLLRLVVDGLAWVLTHIGSAFSSFYHGLGQALGISPTLTSLIVLLFGLALLLSGLRALFRGRIFAAAIAGIPGIAILSWLIQ
ncbi:hypothetical protein [Salinisphaera hydrothermalis]|uniref:hypothetical protein n=1 Tax=Salinisphaera hydrothermalis TaxID=563188 RepID=UPI00334247E4